MSESASLVREFGVAPAPAEKAATASRALVRAFWDYPLLEAISPQEAPRKKICAALYGSIYRYCARHGRIWTDRDANGAACWLPPDDSHPTLWREIRAGFLVVPFACGWTRFRALSAYGSLTEKAHRALPEEPYWYLWAIGVTPEGRGRGLAGALMHPVLDIADQTRVACRLETHVEKNVRLYQKHGFEIVLHQHPPTRPLPQWTMARRPR